MYAYIKGTYYGTNGQYIIIEAGGVGYKICATTSALSKMPDKGKEAMVFTYLNVREDAMELYGFATEEELQYYEKLTSVSGVGPKVGIAILSSVSLNDIAHSIATEDAKPITKAPGVGPKLAKRIILELKDKFKADGISESENIPVSPASAERQEAAEALTALGYSSSEALKAVEGLDGNVEEIISLALKNLMKRG